ncbi:MAG: hypothetical protein VB131_07560 [Burkholderia gladioli]
MKKNFFTTTLGRVSAPLRARAGLARRIAAGVVTSAAVHAAYAGGGLNAGTQAANNFVLWFYGFVGICAGGYLTWVGFECWSNRAEWVKDFGGGVAKVAATGAGLVLAGWAFGLFG